MGGGIGYVDKISMMSATKWRLADPAAAANYRPGGVVHAFLYDGYQVAIGQLCSRRIIQNVAGDVLTFTSGIDPRCNAVKSYPTAAPIIQDVRSGQTSVSVPNATMAQAFTPGDYVFLTSGPELANEAKGEYARVVGVQNVSVQLALPIQRAYRSAIIAKMQPVKDVTLRNLTLDVPVNPASNTFWVKFVTNLTLDNVTVNGHLGLGDCSNVTLRNCTITGNLGVGASCHACSFVNCRMGRLALEEGNFDIECAGCTFGPSPVPLQATVGCERLTFRACKITGASNMPVAVEGADITFYDLDIAQSTRPLNAYFSGNRLRLSRVRADCAVVVSGGSGMALSGIQAVKVWPGWLAANPCGGTMLDCGPLATDDEYRQAGPQFARGVWRP
jgi:hypothetical protein